MSQAPHPTWLIRSRAYDGVAEIKGPHHNPKILHLLDLADGKAGDGKTLQGIRDDETPWCATYVSGVLEETGIASARSAWARSYLGWGFSLSGPAVGAICVLERGPNSGHVAFVVGKDAGGNLLLHGGNQGDKVKVSAFDPGRVLGFRWPKGPALPALIGFPSLPVLKANAPLSTNEA